MSPVVEHAAQALVALDDAKHHIRMVSRLVGSSEDLDMLAFDIEKMGATIMTVIKAAQGNPIARDLT